MPDKNKLCNLFVAQRWHRWWIKIRQNSIPSCSTPSLDPGCWRQQGVLSPSDITTDKAGPPKQSWVVCESERAHWQGEQPVSSVRHQDWRLCCQPTACQRWLSLSHAPRQRPGEWAGRLSHTYSIFAHMLLLPQASVSLGTHPGSRIVLQRANAGLWSVLCHYGDSYALQSCHELLKIDTTSRTVWAATFKEKLLLRNKHRGKHVQNSLVHFIFCIKMNRITCRSNSLSSTQLTGE